MIVLMILVILYLCIQTLMDDTKMAHIPILNIATSDYRLRTEVTYYLSQYGIAESMLTFRDQLDLAALHTSGRLRLTLVDHNVLRGDDGKLEGSVCQVLDHHQQERQPSDKSVYV